jgi:class 3 adenylate cyclase
MSIVTFLFTDIEASTRRWRPPQMPWRVALETHNETLRKAADACHVFNYTGDGMCAVFDSPRSAIDAAVAGVKEGSPHVPRRPAPLNRRGHDPRCPPEIQAIGEWLNTLAHKVIQGPRCWPEAAL